MIFFILVTRPRIFDTIGIIAQVKLSVNFRKFRYFKALKVSFSNSQDPDDKNVQSKMDHMSVNWNSDAIEDLSSRQVSESKIK